MNLQTTLAIWKTQQNVLNEEPYGQLLRQKHI